MSYGEISAFYTEFEQFMEFYRSLCRFCSKSMWRKICPEKICVDKKWQIWGLPPRPPFFYQTFTRQLFGESSKKVGEIIKCNSGEFLSMYLCCWRICCPLLSLLLGDLYCLHRDKRPGLSHIRGAPLLPRYVWLSLVAGDWNNIMTIWIFDQNWMKSDQIQGSIGHDRERGMDSICIIEMKNTAFYDSD